MDAAPGLSEEAHSNTSIRRRGAQAADPSAESMSSSRSPTTLSTSVENLHVRTPRTNGDMYEESDEVELSLLGDGHGRPKTTANMIEEEETDYTVGPEVQHKPQLSARDKRAMVLLIVLYLIQGVPVGLAMGSLPFLMQDKVSYSDQAVFTFCQYPYSLKLLWSPIVDALFIPSIGRRKTWIIPMQLVIGSLMFWIAMHVQDLLDHPGENIRTITVTFTSLVFFAATQDIAVDGWALTLLSQENLSYASTCQTVGLTTGYFASFTVFLALNSEEFAAHWGIPRLTLAAYLQFWGVMCFGVSFWLLLVEKENKEASEDDMNIKGVYKTMWSICQLKHVQSLLLMHFFAKVGYQANDAVTQLKMVEKGLSRTDLSLTVLIDFPLQIVGGWLAARWSIGEKPLRPWIHAFWVRFAFAGLAMLLIWWWPKPPITKAFLGVVIVHTILQSFSGTIQFVGVSAFHARISDPLIGGTYMTLLNTVTNLGGTWPRYFVLKGVDVFTVATCKVTESGEEVFLKATECVSEKGKELCKQLNGVCITEQDGYYITSIVCLTIGVLTLIFFIIPTATRLQSLPTKSWRVKMR